MIINRPRLFSVLRKEIPKRKPFTEGVYYTEEPKPYYIRDINKNRRQSIIEKSKKNNEIKKRNLNVHLKKIIKLRTSNRFMNLYRKANNGNYTNSEYKKEVNRLSRPRKKLYYFSEIDEKRKEWIRLLNEIKRTPAGMRWFILYSVYYNHIANKNFVKKIYSGNIPRENEAQFIGKLNRRFENVRNVNLVKNSANLARRIKTSTR